MTEKSKAPGSEIFDQALKSYEQTLRSGLKLQEETGRWWTDLLTQATSGQDWQKRVTAATNEVIAPTQKRMEEYLVLIEQNNRTNVNLLKQALEAAQTAAPSDSKAKWVDFWGASLSALRANAQAVTQINSKMIESWISFLKKNAVELSEPAGSKA